MESIQQVTQEDALPKIVCHNCWNQIETFQSFVQRIVTIREDYLRQPLNEFDKEEGELDGTVFIFPFFGYFSIFQLIKIRIVLQILSNQWFKWKCTKRMQILNRWHRWPMMIQCQMLRRDLKKGKNDCLRCKNNPNFA